MRALPILGAALVATAAFAAPGRGAPASSALGLWGNPRGTLEVQTAPCGERLCGAIVRASPAALADAKEAGVDNLIGLQLLQDYRATSPGNWSGRVYVPDMGRTFSSRIEQTSPDSLKISGCLIGGFFCKSQVWHRIR